MSELFAKLMAEGQHQKEQVEAVKDRPKPVIKATREVTQKPTHVRDTPREMLRGTPRELPTRDEIQEFSFRLRDELKIKVQAEVPHGWQEELEEMARQLKVRKLELYRFILGEFLGKVQRRKPGQ